MSLILRLQKVCIECGNIWYPNDEAAAAQCPECGSNNVANEKSNLIVTIMFYCIGLVVLGLTIISWRPSELPPAAEPLSNVADSLTSVEEQIALPPVEEESSPVAEAAQDPLPSKPIVKEEPDAPEQKTVSPEPSLPVADAVPAKQEEVAPVETPPPQESISSNNIAFSLWSISELRLRRAYTKLMNDGSFMADLMRKEYLLFVNNRAKKCGELNAKFEKNINTLDKINFKDGDATILECHSAENTSEYNRLHVSVDED